MRVTDRQQLLERQRVLQTATGNLDRTQQQLSSGRRINIASDDPQGTALALAHRADIANGVQMRRNIDNGTAFLNATETALSGATDLIQRARELTVQASNGTLSDQDKQAIAKEVDQITQEMVQIGNTNFGGAYIFAGHKTQTPAFTFSGSPLATVTYQGDNGQRLHQISKDESVATNVIGSTVFGSVFSDLISLRNTLNTPGATPATIGGSISALDGALDRIVQARADVGARVNRFDLTKSRSEDSDTNLTKLRAQLEEVDLTSTVVQFNAEQNALQAALGAIGKTANLSLVNFLQ